MDTPLVSILVPIYNVEKFIRRCVESLMDQSYKNIEYIFVNDNTPDNSIDILKEVINKHPERTNWRIINHSENKGLAASRNTGIENAKGEWITFVDSDDFLDKNAIEYLITNAIDNNSEIAIGEFSIITSKEIYKYNRPKQEYEKLDYIQTLLRWNEIDLTLWGKIFKRDLFIKNNIKSHNGYNFGEDFAVTPRLCYYANKITFVNKVVYYYENSNYGSYCKQISMASIDSLIFIASFIVDFFKEKPEYSSYKRHLYIGLTRMKLWMCNNHYINDINKIDAIINKNHLSIDFYYKFINLLLNSHFSYIIQKINHIIKIV